MQERREEKLDQRELLLKANAEEVARVRETLSIQTHDTLALYVLQHTVILCSILLACSAVAEDP